MLNVKVSSCKVQFSNKIESVIDCCEGAVVKISLDNPNISNKHSFIGRATIDTGAEYTVVSNAVVKHLNLPVVNKANLIQAGSSVKADIVSVNFRVIDDSENTILMFNKLNVIATSMESYLDCLIGRDILEKCVFIYDGRNQKFSLE